MKIYPTTPFKKFHEDVIMFIDIGEIMKVNKITIYRANARVDEEAGLQNQ